MKSLVFFVNLINFNLPSPYYYVFFSFLSLKPHWQDAKCDDNVMGGKRVDVEHPTFINKPTM